MAAASSSIIMGLSSIGGAFSQSQATKAQGRYQEQVSAMNTAIADQAADDAISRGSKAANAQRRNVRKVVGDQRAALAAQGLDLGFGDAASIVDETNAIGEEDAKTITSNAYMEAFGFKRQAANSAAEGKFASMAAANTARNTILTGGMQALSYGVKGYGEYAANKAKDEKAKEAK